jgi:hypothetical protein
VVDEVEQRGLSPVEVVEDDDDRLLGGEPFEQAADRPEELVLARRRLSPSSSARRDATMLEP